MSKPLLEIRGLTIQAENQDGRSILVDGVSLEIAEHTICALVGDSGSGKSLVASSILGILAGNLTATGEILFQGRNLLSLTEKQLGDIRGRQIGIVMQNTAGSLNPLAKNGRQLSMVLRGHCADKKDIHTSAVRALEKVRLPGPEQIMRAYPHQLSGGMKQRFLTAMGISGSPALLILDEPTKGLDLVLRKQITGMISSLHAETGIAILLITHDLELAGHLAEDCTVMRGGRVTSYGRTRQLFEALDDAVLSDLLAAERELSGYYWREEERGEARA